MVQDFFINRGSELPLLRVELNNDGRDDFRKFYLAIQHNDGVFFTMTNLATNIKKIARAQAEVVFAEDSTCEEKYILQYKWKKRDTNERGKFVGHFHILFNDNIVAEGITFPKGELIVPIAEELIINIQ